MDYLDALKARDFAAEFLPDDLRTIYAKKNSESTNGISNIDDAVREWGHGYPVAGAIGVAAITAIEIAEHHPIIHSYLHGKLPWTIRPNPKEGNGRVVKCQKTLDEANQDWKNSDAPALFEAILNLSRIAELDPPKWLSANKEPNGSPEAVKRLPAKDHPDTRPNFMDDVTVSIPELHPEIAALIESGTFRGSIVDIATQAHAFGCWRTQTRADQIKAAIARGFFEITGGGSDNA